MSPSPSQTERITRSVRVAVLPEPAAAAAANYVRVYPYETYYLVGDIRVYVLVTEVIFECHTNLLLRVNINRHFLKNSRYFGRYVSIQVLEYVILFRCYVVMPRILAA